MINNIWGYILTISLSGIFGGIFINLLSSWLYKRMELKSASFSGWMQKRSDVKMEKLQEEIEELKNNPYRRRMYASEEMRLRMKSILHAVFIGFLSVLLMVLNAQTQMSVYVLIFLSAMLMYLIIMFIQFYNTIRKAEEIRYVLMNVNLEYAKEIEKHSDNDD